MDNILLWFFENNYCIEFSDNLEDTVFRQKKRKEKKLHDNINYLMQQQDIDIETLSICE